MKRLIYVPVFEDNPVSFNPAEYPFSVVADSERLTDLLAGILEDLAGIGGDLITVSDSKENNRGFVVIGAEFPGQDTDFPGERLEFMIKECELAGGFFSCEKEGDVISIAIELPAA
jgi:hypothetical protein